MKLALVTVSSNEFVLGTAVLLRSFFDQNPWFRGDLVVICEELNADSLQILEQFPNILFMAPRPELTAKINQLIKELPHYSKVRQRFFSIMAFNLSDYDKVIFADSDMLCTGSLEHVVNAPHAFQACPDHRMIKGFRRERKTFEWVIQNEKIEHKVKSQLMITFNAGFMIVSSEHLNLKTYNHLCELVTMDTYNPVVSGQTDTVALNLHFHKTVHLLPTSYNLYTRMLEGLNEENRSWHLRYSKMLHYLGSPKPWQIMNRPLSERHSIQCLEEWECVYHSLEVKASESN